MEYDKKIVKLGMSIQRMDGDNRSALLDILWELGLPDGISKLSAADKNKMLAPIHFGIGKQKQIDA